MEIKSKELIYENGESCLYTINNNNNGTFDFYAGIMINIEVLVGINVSVLQGTSIKNA